MQGMLNELQIQIIYYPCGLNSLMNYWISGDITNTFLFHCNLPTGMIIQDF